MAVDKVTVMNTDGTLLMSGDDAANASTGKMARLEKTVGLEIQDNVRRTLAPYLGTGNFEISVAARLSTDKVSTNETIYNPESKVERSVRTIKETEVSQNKQRPEADDGSAEPAGRERSRRMPATAPARTTSAARS